MAATDGEAKDAMRRRLVSMGFPEDLSAAALAATGAESTSLAAEWILNQQQQPGQVEHAASPSPYPQTPPPPAHPTASTPSPSTSAAHRNTLGRYFHTANSTARARPKPPHPPPSKEEEIIEPPPDNKRQKVGQPSPSSSQAPRMAWQPLSERMRPRTIDEVVGQDHLLGPTSILRSALSRGLLPSLVLWGPPGTGKTSIARALAASCSTTHRFVMLSAVTSGVKDVRDAVEEARRRRRLQQRTVLFVDEIHRFNKAQLDSFLAAIEDGSIVLVGATTENPSFHLTTPLLSRCRVLALRPLQPEDVARLLRRAADDRDQGLVASLGGGDCKSVSVEEEAVEFISVNCDGDARVALNALEVAATLASARIPFEEAAPSESSSSTPPAPTAAAATININDVKEALQCKHFAYDRDGEEHYNLISALHKSMRGSDPDAAIYWLARMLQGGEQPLYIARRLVRFASEDIGLADPGALPQAVACYQACHFIGMPECDVILAHCVAYLALAPKSVAAYKAMNAAKEAVRESAGGNEGVPLHLRNAPTKLMKDFGYGKGYIYPPDNPDAPLGSFLPPSLQGRKFLDWPPRTE